MFVKNGFTLFELLIVAVLISAVLSLAFIINSNLFFNTALRDQTKSVEGALRKAQAVAITGRGDSNAGVKITENDYTIFEGNSYEERKKPLDTTVSFSTSMIISGTNEIIFEKSTGLPITQEENIFVRLHYANNYKTITINSEGMIESDL
jgi:prepilin-type N-terminal cleavage/methylation domain-containing protein